MNDIQARAAAVDSSLNGAQITAAASVMDKLKAGDVAALVAVELLTAVGIPRDTAEKMVTATQKDAQDQSNGASAPTKDVAARAATIDGTAGVLNTPSLKVQITEDQLGQLRLALGLPVDDFSTAGWLLSKLIEKIGELMPKPFEWDIRKQDLAEMKRGLGIRPNDNRSPQKILDQLVANAKSIMEKTPPAPPSGGKKEAALWTSPPPDRSVGVRGRIYLYALASTAVATDAVQSASLPKSVNGLAAFYYWRQSARDGEYVHPVKGFKLSIDPSRRAKWADGFRKLQAAGVPVPVVADHALSAAATLGYVVDVRNTGDCYEELHQYLGERERDMALRNRISLGIDPDFRDGKGQRFGEVVFHSAATPVPVISDTGQAEQILNARILDDTESAAGVRDILRHRRESPTVDLSRVIGNRASAIDGLERPAGDIDPIAARCAAIGAAPTESRQ